MCASIQLEVCMLVLNLKCASDCNCYNLIALGDYTTQRSATGD